MAYFLIGLVVFLGAHSVRIFAEGWRARTIARVGENAWKGVYSIVSIAGFVLLAWGYGQARASAGFLYVAPHFLYPVTSLLSLIAFVLLAAAYVPGNHIKAAVGHPMVAGVKVWAFAHLLSNGGVADVILFGSFLAWAVADFAAARRRDRTAGMRYQAGKAGRTLTAGILGVAAWIVFAFWAHEWLIGVRPFA